MRPMTRRLLPLLFALAIPAAGEIVPGLEDFGSVTLVDSIDCARDTTHRFRDYPAGRSYTTNILGRLTRVMHHVTKEENNGKRTGAYVSWRIGEGKGIVPNDPYLLVVDYPDDAPRSVTLFNFGIAARHGYHTGFTVGESMSPQVAVPQCLESVAIPFSGEWKQLVEVVFPFERATQYDGGSRIDVAQNGFDIDFVLVSQDQATDSVGLAVQSVRLYRIDRYEDAKPEIHYPAGDAPRRYVTSREEMGDNDGLDSYATPADYYVGKARIMSLLGMNCFSRDLLEFGYVQGWSSNRRWGWNADPSMWGKTVDAMAAEGHSLFPIYEYHGSRGDGNTRYVNGGSLGYDADYRPWTLESAAYPDRKYLFSNAYWVTSCAVDLTLPEALVDLKDLVNRTILQYKDRGHFVGAWIRNRGGMPVGFSDKTIALFNRETSRSVTRAQLYNGGSYADTQLYKAYRAWWYAKRRDQFAAVQAYMSENGLPGAKFFYHSCGSEGGRPAGEGAIESNDADMLYNGQTWRQMTGRSATTSLPAHFAAYWSDSIGRDSGSWGQYEQVHSDPADDYGSYASLENVGLSFPFNCLYTVAGDDVSRNYRNASGDLVFARHYSLNEFCANDYNLPEGEQSIVGYYTTDMDHAGRAVMCSELLAMAVNDPTILGYLFGSNLDRLDAPYVREFNLNFLSLPATTSTVLLGGTCSDAVTIRKWTTSAGNYWAVINVSPRPVSGSWNLQTSKTRVWRTLDWREERVSGGKVTLALQPYQMVCLTDVEPPAIVAPVIGEIAADPLAARTATLSVQLTTLGENATSANVAWTLSGGPAAAATGTLSYSAPGAKSAALSGLAPDTAYSVALVATSSTGKTSLRSFSFRTPRFPVALGVPFAETDANGTSATATVTVTRADRDATLVLKAGSATVATWTGVAAGESYSASFAVALGTTKGYTFSLVHADPATGERYEAKGEGSVLGRKAIGWLDVRFDRSAYDSWPFAGSGGRDPADGGTWTRTTVTNNTAFATDGGNRRLELETGSSDYVAYAASAASHARYAVLVRGRAQFVSEPGAPEAPTDSPLAGLALGDEGGGVSLYGWTRDGWVRLAGADVAENEWTDWNAAIDFSASPVTVTYGIGGAVLSNAVTGATAFRVAGSPTSLRTVRYVGSGAVDDFRGVYYEPVTIVAIREPVFAEGAASGPLSLYASNGSQRLALAVSTAGQPADTQYTAFTSKELDPDPAKWTAAADSRVASRTEINAGAMNLDIPASADTLFVRIVASDHSIAKGTKLSALGL